MYEGATNLSAGRKEAASAPAGLFIKGRVVLKFLIPSESSANLSAGGTSCKLANCKSPAFRRNYELRVIRNPGAPIWGYQANSLRASRMEVGKFPDTYTSSLTLCSKLQRRLIAPCSTLFTTFNKFRAEDYKFAPPLAKSRSLSYELSCAPETSNDVRDIHLHKLTCNLLRQRCQITHNVISSSWGNLIYRDRREINTTPLYTISFSTSRW